MKTAKGYTLYSDDSIAVIATMESANRKTGNMVQVWILCSNINPVDAVKTGEDSTICGTCIHRGNKSNYVSNGEVERKRSCYVNVGWGPNRVYKAFKRGAYPRISIADYAQVFGGRAIRLGAYGDPAAIPQNVVLALCAVASRHTGYTHQYATAPWLKPYVMASVDTIAQYEFAVSNGWRTFRVSSTMQAQPKEIECVATRKGSTVQCITCTLCDGASASKKNIMVHVHGTGASNVIPILDNAAQVYVAAALRARSYDEKINAFFSILQ